MYDTILLSLDISPTDRPIIEHVKELAGIMHSRVILLRVATGAAAQFHGKNAAGEEIAGIHAYLDKVKAEFEAAGHPGYGGNRLRRARKRDYQVGQRKRLRPAGHGHPRA